MIQKCVDKEIEKELYLARFYYRTKKYPVAIKKLEELSLQGTDNIEYIGNRNLLLAKAYIKTDASEQAATILNAFLADERLVKYHPAAKKYLNRAK